MTYVFELLVVRQVDLSVPSLSGFNKFSFVDQGCHYFSLRTYAMGLHISQCLCGVGHFSFAWARKFQTSEYVYGSPRLFIWIGIMMKSKDFSG
jgi:hypothetical protein